MSACVASISFSEGEQVDTGRFFTPFATDARIYPPSCQGILHANTWAAFLFLIRTYQY